ncbi:MAG: serine/threonine protein kinase [Polyangiaceae bacterium]|nr:serine/threonine protein kinase [Polyangiaceae bacterium]
MPSTADEPATVAANPSWAARDSALEFSFSAGRGSTSPSTVPRAQLTLPHLDLPEEPSRSRPGRSSRPSGTGADQPRAREAVAGVSIAPPLVPRERSVTSPPRFSSGFPPGEAPTLKTHFAPPDDRMLTLEQAGRYDWEHDGGEGAPGRLRAAFDRHLMRKVAVRRFDVAPQPTRPEDKDGAMTPPAELRFVCEARILGQLAHPGIVPVYELGRRHDGALFFTTPLGQGVSLADLLQGRDFPERLALLPQFLTACSAVAHAHSRGVVHRRLGTAAIVLGNHGEAVVGDWGFARRHGELDAQGPALAAALAALRRGSAPRADPQAVLQSLQYLPPEAVSGEVELIDERSDVYSLGAILYELVVGEPPFDDADGGDIVRAVLGGAIPAPERCEPRCPAALGAIIERALARDPDERYPTAEAMADELGAFVTARMVAAPAGSVPSPRLGLRSWLLLVGVVAALIAVGVGAWQLRGRFEARVTEGAGTP